MRPGPRTDRLASVRPPRLARALLAALLVVAVGACSGAGQDPWEGQDPESLVISSGGAAGIYHGYGQRYAEVLQSHTGTPVDSVETGGSVENLQALADGQSHVAFSAVDAAADAVAGRGLFEEPLEITALARIYDDFVHLVVPADSDIRTVRDLRGRRVSLGAPGSGTGLIAGRLLEAARVQERDLVDEQLGINSSIEALQSGEIEAFFWSGGLRTPGLSALADDLPIRLVPLDDLVDTVRADHGSGYRHGVVPEGTYGLRQEVETMAVPNVLVVRADLPEPVAHRLVATLFEERSEIAAEVPAAGLLDRARAIFTDPVPLHPGALRYYRDTKE